MFLLSLVPSENKKDVRSIEETMNEIRARKRQKTSNNETGSKDDWKSACMVRLLYAMIPLHFIVNKYVSFTFRFRVNH